MRSIGDYGGGDARNFPTHVNPEPRSSRSAMASKSVKGRVRTTRKPTECNVCLRTDPQAEVHDTTSPPGVPKLHNHEEGGSLGAYTPELGGQDRHLGSKEQWPDEGPSPVYSKRIAIYDHGGVTYDVPYRVLTWESGLESYDVCGRARTARTGVRVLAA